jgi:Zn-dependent protease
VSEQRPEQRPDPLDWSARAGESEADEYRDQRWDEYDLERLRGYEPIHPEPTWRVVVRRLWAPIAVIAALIWKFKAAALAVFKFKFVGTALSGLVSIGAYALLWSWWFAIGLVVLLFVHEMGHVLEARRQGLPTSAPMFIPFMGALITMKQLPHDVWREARLALAGPIIGSLGAAAFWAFGAATDRDFFTAMAYVGFFLNLFNLLPIVPLDGGRAVAALHPAFWLVGLVGLAALLVVFPNPILILILIIGGLELWSRWRHRGTDEARAYYSITPGRRVAVAVTYLGLAAVLAVAMGATHIERDL